MIINRAKPGLLCLALLLSTPAHSQEAWTPATVVDRAMIEDLLVDYYAQLGAGRHDFGAFFLADGVIDVNGTVAKGKQAIEEVYSQAAAANPPKPGVFRMVLTNVRVSVKGDAATADCIWTGVHSANVNATPTFVEQGREHDQLKKVNGRWYFQHRTITSDGGLDPKSFFAKTYRKR